MEDCRGRGDSEGEWEPRDTMIPMGDGVRLATDLYLPCHGDGSLLEDEVPALLVRTSYDKTAPEWDDIIPYYVRRGYAFVVQDLRSRFRSEGDGSYFHTANPWEGDDGYDTVEWLATRDWCSGKIGTLGSSHRAITQTQLALRKPPHLAAMWVEAFETAPVADDTEITGAVTVNLWVSSTAVDTDFTVKLIDVYPASQGYPEGYHLNLVDTIQRVRYRKSWTKPEPMIPGKPYELTVTLWPTSNVFKKGHRIRVDISSSNFPRFDVNPNTGEPVGKHTRMVTADNTVHTSTGLPSCVVLPIIPAGEE